MACTNYSNNGSVNVVFSMSTLPGGFCPANFQALMDAVAQYLVGTLPGNYSTFLISDTTPAAVDRDKLWVSVDTNCKPVGFFLYNTTHGEWLPVGQKVFDGGTAGGTANALTATADPELKYLADGCLFIVKAGADTNTGPATLNVSGTGTYPVTKQGNQTLSGGEIRPDMVLLLNARDLLTVPYYELLNPSPAQAALDPQDRVVNGSFELSTLGTGIPDGWSFAAIGAGAGAVSTGVAGHGAQSFGVTISSTGGGTLTQDELMPCNDGEVMALSFWNYTTDTATDDAVVVDWFAEDGTTPVGAPITIWSGVFIANRTANTWQRMFAGMSAPAGARFFQISVSGGLTGGASTQTSYFDGLLVDTVVFKRRCEFHYTAAAYNFVPPTGVTVVRATVIGGGGAGSIGGGSPPQYRGGGGAGGTVVAITPVTPGDDYTVVVGRGGSASPVVAASESSFNGVIAQPGGPGVTSFTPTGNGGAGGSGTVPSGSFGWILSGGDGGETPNLDLAGRGGHGGNGSGGGGLGGYSAVAGTVGSNYGGGGGGGAVSGGIASGNGAVGFVVIEF